MSLGALGVVYGDIGTSPLYALRESFESEGLVVMDENILGILSLVFWSLLVVISIKYLTVVMRADNDGEGGILALTALILPPRRVLTSRGERSLILVGLFGTALLFGDGMITPAISVLSAVEGIEVATPVLKHYVVPIALLILVGLFMIQRHGTGAVGRVFGPVMVTWFSVLALLGLPYIVESPQVLAALNPIHAFQFFANNGWRGFLALGSVFLVVTGSEALYADMGHFGRRPIATSWYVAVFPALLLTYFGQGAFLLGHPEGIANPFYLMAPDWAVWPLVVAATGATIVASQALISGAFSLTMQAILLGYLPRMRIIHTSATERGQVYIPAMNWALMVAALGLVLGFRSSSNLAGAYGVAVATTMVITTVLIHAVMRERWGWSAAVSGAVAGGFLVGDLAYFGANLFKIPDGGWFPLVVGLGIFTLMTTWKKGRELLVIALRQRRTADRNVRRRHCQIQARPGSWDGGVHVLPNRPDATCAARQPQTQQRASDEQYGALECSDAGKHQVEEDERVRVESGIPIEDHPQCQERECSEHERPRAHADSKHVGGSLPLRQLVAGSNGWMQEMAVDVAQVLEQVLVDVAVVTPRHTIDRFDQGVD